MGDLIHPVPDSTKKGCSPFGFVENVSLLSRRWGLVSKELAEAKVRRCPTTVQLPTTAQLPTTVQVTRRG